jgi:RNA polymerase sigma-70 factor (ECF subfamily)
MPFGSDGFEIAATGRLSQSQKMALSRHSDSGEQHLVSLMRAIAADADKTAFAELFDVMAPKVKGFLIAGGAANDVAEDVMQEVMFKLWNKAGMYDPVKSSVSTWIFTIARNARIDLIRKERRPDLDPEDPAIKPVAAKSQDDEMDIILKAEKLRDVLQSLPPDQLEVVRLSYYGDLSHGEIAQKINIPFGTVKSRLRLALTRLKSAMEELK